MLRDPYLTSCGHSFCHDCIVSQFRDAPTTSCPRCGEARNRQVQLSSCARQHSALICCHRGHFSCRLTLSHPAPGAHAEGCSSKQAAQRGAHRRKRASASISRHSPMESAEPDSSSSSPPPAGAERGRPAEGSGEDGSSGHLQVRHAPCLAPATGSCQVTSLDRPDSRWLSQEHRLRPQGGAAVRRAAAEGAAGQKAAPRAGVGAGRP